MSAGPSQFCSFRLINVKHCLLSSDLCLAGRAMGGSDREAKRVLASIDKFLASVEKIVKEEWRFLRFKKGLYINILMDSYGYFALYLL